MKLNKKLFVGMFALILVLGITPTLSAQSVVSMAEGAIAEARSRGITGTAADPVAITSDPNRTWMQQLGHILGSPNSYTTIVGDFRRDFPNRSLPTYNEVMADQNLFIWWEQAITRPGRFPHLAGRAVDIRVRGLNEQQKREFEQILRNRGFTRIIYEIIPGRNSSFDITNSIQQATHFHVER